MDTTITLSDLAALTEELKDKGMNAPIYVTFDDEQIPYPAIDAKVTPSGAISIHARKRISEAKLREALLRADAGGTD